ncbi:hypothetical protein [Streptomyces alboflavus]|uniref:hypothetical protein n=1 Tax=Streptomyces alboflavus TaxID=67267 RepID=UPI0030024D7D
MKWQVIALAGQEIRLLGAEGEGEVVLAGHLFADPGFAVVGEQVPQAAPQWGLFETAPAAAREKALAWLRHIREVESGLPDGPGSAGTVRPQYAPERFTLAEREQAKAEELTALGYGRVSRTTVQRMRLAYRKQGLWGLVDHRTTRSPSRTGRADERVVAAVREALGRQRGRSKGTVNALFPVIKQILTTRHGAGTVPVPSQATLYRLVTALARPGELPTSPVRTTPSSYEGRAYTPTVALRPGEQVQIDTTRLDVLALFDDGTPARPDLTIAVDVASRAILAAVLCPSTTKAVDAALLLAEMAVPPPARPTWPAIWRMDRSPLLPTSGCARSMNGLRTRPPGRSSSPRQSWSTGGRSSSPGRSTPPAKPSASASSPPRPTHPPPRASSSGPSARSTTCSASTCPATPAPTSPTAARTPTRKPATASPNCKTSSMNGSSPTTTGPTKGYATRSCRRRRSPRIRCGPL